MPIAFDPTATIEFTLDSDAGIPEAQRPKFTTRYLTAREYTICRKLQEEAYGIEDQEAALEKLRDAAMLGITSWSGLQGRDGAPVLYGQHDLADILTVHELDELFWAKLRAVTLGEIDRKKSVPPSPCDTATAGTCPPSPATAATPMA